MKDAVKWLWNTITGNNEEEKNNVGDGTAIAPPSSIGDDVQPPSESVIEDSSEAKFQKTVEEMKQKDGFKQGDYWGYDNTYVDYYNGYYIGGSQCFAMAHMMQVEVMGGRGYNIGSESKSNIQVGDVINYDGHGTNAQSGHWVFVLEKTDDYIIVSEGNWIEKVNYGRKIYQCIRLIDTMDNCFIEKALFKNGKDM